MMLNSGSIRFREPGKVLIQLKFVEIHGQAIPCIRSRDLKNVGPSSGSHMGFERVEVVVGWSQVKNFYFIPMDDYGTCCQGIFCKS